MKRKSLILFIIISLLSLSSCNSRGVFTPFDFDGEFLAQKEELNEEHYYRNSEYDTLSWRGRNGVNTIRSYKDVVSSKSNTNPQAFTAANSEGEINALVIPVNFIDSDKTNQKQKVIDLQNAFFGDSNKTSFVSVSEYYYRSSYGQLKINGFVSDFYTYPKTIKEMNEASKSVSTSRRVAASAVDWFYNTYSDLDMTIFDKDNNKYFDAIYFIYDHPYIIPTTQDELFWAYVDYSYRGEGKEGEIRNNHEICIGPYAWLSFDFFKENAYLDTHTLIHESGHLFGLEDYYNTSNSSKYQPTGFMDMMDCNLGDHTSFSKMLLNWVTPIVLKDEGNITLRPFESSGDVLLIPNSKGYNNTPYDEYLLLEFYSPTGLNKLDVGKKYQYISSNGDNGVFQFFSTLGVKVYHVDARLALFESKNNGNPFVMLDDPNLDIKIDNFISDKTANYCVDFAFDNSPYQNYEVPVLYHLLESSGNNTFLNGTPGNNNTLFRNKDTFGIDTFTDFTFNNGGTLEYSFEITSLNSEEVSISFTKK